MTIVLYFVFYQAKNSIYITINWHQPTRYARKGYQRIMIINTEMAPDIATKHNFCHHKQGKISKKQFQKAVETVSEPLLVYNK